jgi:arsenite methyltransferase
MKTLNAEQIHETVQQRYAAIARGAGHCCGDSCSRGVSLGRSSRFGYSRQGLGCGDPVTPAKIQPDETVLDLGSGAGGDCLQAARQVGPTGHVIGVDMTPEMIAKARANAAGAGHSNVEFRQGKIENLPVKTGTVDVVISNCVVNLSPDKPRAFAEAFRVLKPGGRLVISDIVATEPLPADVRRNTELWSGCVAGAATVEEVKSMLMKAGFRDVSVTIKGGCENLSRLEGVASATITARKPKAPATRRTMPLAEAHTLQSVNSPVKAPVARETVPLARRISQSWSAFDLPAAPMLLSFQL